MDEPHIRRLSVPPKKSLFNEFRANVKEMFFHDEPLRDFKDQSTSKKLWLGIQAVFPIIEWMRYYNLTKLRGDIVAGLTIASLCIPQDIGYAKLANMDPKYVLYSSFVPPRAGLRLHGELKRDSHRTVAVVSLLVGTLAQEEINPKDHPHEFRRLVFTATFFARVVETALGFFRSTLSYPPYIL